MKNENALSWIGINHLLKVAVLVLVFVLSTTSCSDSSSSSSSDILGDTTNLDGGSRPLADDNLSVLQVYSEMGETGMRVTYSPMSLLTFTNVEELEKVYADLMACVGLSTATAPSILLSNDELLFHVRDDGTDVQGYYDEDTSLVTVYADDVDASYGNQYWWTRHGMIEYLIDVHGLNPDSAISPFMSCHWADN